MIESCCPAHFYFVLDLELEDEWRQSFQSLMTWRATGTQLIRLLSVKYLPYDRNLLICSLRLLFAQLSLVQKRFQILAKKYSLFRCQN